MRTLFRSSLVGLMICGAALTTAAIPAHAQDTDEIVITSRGIVSDGVRTLSQRVSYSDLNLNRSADREELRVRVRQVADNLCRLLDEPVVGSGAVVSCNDSTYRDAMRRVGSTNERFAPRGTTWIAS